MRVIKSFSASLLTRSFELHRKQYLGVTVLLFSPLGKAAALLPEKELWPFWATQPEAQGPLDEGIPRRFAEYLVCGSGYTQSQRRDAVAVRAQVGGLKKELVVWGQRHWDGLSPTPAQAFASMRLGWAQAYGGEDFAANPVGSGRKEQEIEGLRVRPLPRIEYPQHPLVSPRGEGVPAGLGPIDMLWASRAALRGSYDAAWFKDHYPGLAPDVDWRFFNVAPADQRQDLAFVGDEAYSFQNLHPQCAVIEGRLPGLRTRVFAQRGASSALNNAALEELRTPLMALWFFPEAERVVQVYQGVMEVAEDDASDVGLLTVGVERLGQARPAEHYRAVVEKRLDKKRGPLEALRDSDLAPAEITQPLHDFKPTPNRGLERSMRRAEQEREAIRAEVASHGLDPDEHAPPVKGPAPPKVESLDDLLAASEHMERQGEELLQKAKVEKASTLATLKESSVAQGWDFGLIESEMAGEMSRGPPKAMAQAMTDELKQLIISGQKLGGDVRELQEILDDEEVQARWVKSDEGVLNSYRAMAQHQLPTHALSQSSSQDLRDKVVAAHAAAQSMLGWDLTGVDLSGLDLHGADLRQALLESANLSRCNLAGAQLDGAVLVRTLIDSSALQKASLVGVNLSQATLHNSSLAGADLRQAQLEGTTLEKLDLSGCRLDELRLKDVVFKGVDFSRCTSESLLFFHGLDLQLARFKGVDFKQAVFQACQLTGVDLSGAKFGKVAFVGTQADNARFNGVHIGAGCFAMGCSLQRASFHGAQMQQVCLRGTPMAGAVLTSAVLRNSDFSECDLRGARFAGADARGARFVRARLEGASLASANLANAVLQHAWLSDTDFMHANLHEADMARVHVGPGVRFDRAITSRLRTLPRREAVPAAE